MPGAGAVHHIRLGRADHLLGARMRGRCSSVSGPISGGRTGQPWANSGAARVHHPRAPAIRTAQSTARWICHRLLQRGSYCRARADLLEIAADDVLALGDSFEHRDEAAIGGAEQNKALIGLVAFANDVDVFAKLT